MLFNEKVTLYKVDSKDVIRIWEIEQDNNHILISHGALHGEPVQQCETVDKGLAGRSLHDQIVSRIRSRVNKKLDDGYFRTIEEAKQNVGMNASNLPRPMLAQKYDPNKLPDDEIVYVQPKLDGHRCIIGKKNGRVIAYSRKGKEITTINHILNALRDMPEGCFLDGELYVHGWSLQKIASCVKRKQALSEQLQFWHYDGISDRKFSDRFVTHENLNSDRFKHKYIKLIRTFSSKKDEIVNFHNHFLNQGYEGTIIRRNLGGYDIGKRSKQLLKLKNFDDDEFKVIDIVPSTEGAAILICEIPDDTFRVFAPGTFQEKVEALDDRENFIGKYVTVKFAGRTPAGKPFHPTAVCWRELD